MPVIDVDKEPQNADWAKGNRVRAICAQENWWRLACIERLRFERPELPRREAEALVDAAFAEAAEISGGGPFGSDD